jgi:hypothetical protein
MEVTEWSRSIASSVTREGEAKPGRKPNTYRAGLGRAVWDKVVKYSEVHPKYHPARDNGVTSSIILAADTAVVVLTFESVTDVMRPHIFISGARPFNRSDKTTASSCSSAPVGRMHHSEVAASPMWRHRLFSHWRNWKI